MIDDAVTVVRGVLGVPGATLPYTYFLVEDVAVRRPLPQDSEALTVVFLHGWAGAAREWAAIAADAFCAADNTPLAALTYDARGFGAATFDRNDPHATDFSNERYVADLVALLDHLHIGRAVLVGHSWGAVIAMIAAAAHPARVAGLVALNAAYYDPDNLLHRSLARVSYGMAVAMVRGRGLLRRSARARQLAVRRYTARPLSPDVREMVMTDVLAADPQAVIGTLVAGYRVRFRDVCAKITAPTLYLAAGRDPVAPASFVIPFVALTPGSRYVLLPDCGHLPMLEDPTATRAAIAQIVAAV